MSDRYKNKYRISSIRLQKWNYGWNGSYFITVCTKDKQCFFGSINNGKMYLSEIGKIVNKFWFTIPGHFPFVKLDEFVVMPNHIHGIILIDKPIYNDNSVLNIKFVETRHCLVSTTDKPSPETIGQKRFQNQGKNTISSIIGSYKSIVTRNAHKILPEFEWQSRFYDHIIRDSISLRNIRKYIKSNPSRWFDDKFFLETEI